MTARATRKIAVWIFAGSVTLACGKDSTEPTPPVNPTLSVSFTASPTEGDVPLRNVSLNISVRGTATGPVRYQFDCTNDGVLEREETASRDSYLAQDLCNYPTSGNFTARACAERQQMTTCEVVQITVYGIAPIGNRSKRNRPDSTSAFQVQIVYALASDGIDRGLDTTGVIETSFKAMQNWFTAATAQIGGKQFPEDTYQGKLDILFLRSQKTSYELARLGGYIADTLAVELARNGFRTSNKKYLVYYDGTNPGFAGSAMFNGLLGALYLNGQPPISFAQSISKPGYYEFIGAHEILHTWGYIDPRALNHNFANPNHVTDCRNDLMYGGPGSWVLPPLLDCGGNDYYGDAVRVGTQNLKYDSRLVPSKYPGQLSINLTIAISKN